ncbi:mannose-binding protein [Streptomyces sp. NPDC059852]|uniref:mannose-binding protein n=1 Tax=Streptomyces sp. NPDC059852 TaxID=3346972 RepID=UPI0036482023
MARDGAGPARGCHRGGPAPLDERDRASHRSAPRGAPDRRPPDFPAFVQPTTARAPATTDSSATEEEYRMSPQHPTPDANAEAAATRTGGTGSPSSPSAPDEPAPDRGSAAEPGPATTGPGSGVDGPTPASGTEPDVRKREDADGEAGAESAPSGPTRAGGTAAAGAEEAEAESAATGPAENDVSAPGTAETHDTTAPASSAAGASTGSPEARVAVAAAVGTMPPDARTGTGVRSGRPRKPILAGAAVAGAALIAIPLLLTGSARDDGPPDSAKELAAGGSDTVLNPTSAPAALDDYVAEKPSPSPKKAKATKSAPAKVAPAQPAAPAAKPSPSDKPESKPKAKPKPRTSPKPDWSTETVYAPSVLEVNQAWTTNRIRMVMQTDGNLVVYNEQRKPIWASMTFGPNHRAIFQPDGNLVIHNGEDRPIWASQTWGHEGAQLVLRADAKVVIVQNGGVIWST